MVQCQFCKVYESQKALDGMSFDFYQCDGCQSVMCHMCTETSTKAGEDYCKRCTKYLIKERMQRRRKKEMYPIVKYAHLIGKNTADFTASDLGKFIDWLWKQQGKENNMEQKENTVVELRLTEEDVEALKWAIDCVLNDYDFSEQEDVEETLRSIYEVLKTVNNE